MAERNIFLSMVRGTLVGGVVRVYLPIFGINDVPSLLTVVGGCIVTGAIVADSVGTRYLRQAVNAAGNRPFGDSPREGVDSMD